MMAISSAWLSCSAIRLKNAASVHRSDRAAHTSSHDCEFAVPTNQPSEAGGDEGGNGGGGEGKGGDGGGGKGGGKGE